MPSLGATVVAVVATLAAVGQADYSIEPSSVPLSTREDWCTHKMSTCPLICMQLEPGPPIVNEDQLTYGCLCGNNKQPNVSEHTLTLPFFICQEWGNQCVKACVDNTPCVSACREKHPCGATVVKYNGSTAAVQPTLTQTGDGNVIYSNTPGGSGGSNGAGAAVQVGRTYGLAVVLTAIVAGFALL